MHQQNVARYHSAMSQHSDHGGHDMYVFHRDWHDQNRDPRPPERPDRNWGMNLVFGANFLQMHHEMVKATSAEPRQHMMHESIAGWYRSQNLALPAPWDPTQPSPNELKYDPDPHVFPNEILQVVQHWAQVDGVSTEQFLARRTENPAFVLPRYFAIQGVGADEPGEPITGARKLADFRNPNQLGCCLVFPHNQWHGLIGGAMGTTWTAIADPIFYFGVHWQIDQIYDDYRMLRIERDIRTLDSSTLQKADALESEGIEVPEDFTPEQKEWAADQVEISKRLHRW